ncbi:hypothetical protein K9B33_20785 [Sphingobium sp. 3R8]|uniref:hypothetical protein n=1 Tax=Sphingobium sp. 3R8 TaxID=2874921 RepID=UPI001CCD68E4|nr:hypothetical protein [Sphingobium sp. 3R8]MBZ9649974.1 hypothetical protein [Sphingobium sp. 3R8]
MTDDQTENADEVQQGLFVYIMPPAEHWFGWYDLSKVQPDDIFPRHESGWDVERHHHGPSFRAEVDRLLYNGRKLAEGTLGYDGDIASGPYLSLLPAFPVSMPLVAWTQGARGLAFVASAMPLPYLETFREAADFAPQAGKSPLPF